VRLDEGAVEQHHLMIGLIDTVLEVLWRERRGEFENVIPQIWKLVVLNTEEGDFVNVEVTCFWMMSNHCRSCDSDCFCDVKRWESLLR